MRSALPLDGASGSDRRGLRRPRWIAAPRGLVATDGVVLPLTLLGVVLLLAVWRIAEGGRGTRLPPATLPTSFVLEATLGPIERPAGLAIGRDGTTYVVDADRARVMVFAPEGPLARTFGLEVEEASPEDTSGQLTSPLGIALDPDGRIYVSDLEHRSITIFEADGRPAGHFAAPALASARAQPGALTATEAGLLVCDLATHRILLLGWDGTMQRVFAPPPEEALSYPNGVWAAPDGRLYVSDTNHDRVVAFAATGDFLGPVAVGISNPRGLVGDGAGRLYVTATLDHSVVIVELASGRQVERLTAARGQGLGFPTSVALDGDRLLASDRAAAGVHVWRIKGATR